MCIAVCFKQGMMREVSPWLAPTHAWGYFSTAFPNKCRHFPPHPPLPHIPWVCHFFLCARDLHSHPFGKLLGLRTGSWRREGFIVPHPRMRRI